MSAAEQRDIVRNPNLIDDHDIPHYGSININNHPNQDLLIQKRRASSMYSSQAKNLHLASTSIKDGQYQPIDTDIKTEIKMLFSSAIPLMITFLLQFSLTISSVFFVGNIGSNELAAVSLSNLLANISSFGLIEGIASSLSTLCPQAYGRKDYKLVGLHSVRCFFMLMILYIPIFIFWNWGAYPLLATVITEVEPCILAAEYLKILVWSVPGFIVFEVLKLYLQAQGIFHASTIVLLVCAPLNFIITYFLVWNETYGIGFKGAPLAVVITNTLMALSLLFYATFINGYQCWCGWSWDVFRNWSKALKLAGPGVIMIEAEWLAFEIISFASSRFGTEALAAQSIITTICITVYQIPFSISVAGSTRIAWFIGSDSKRAAMTSLRAVIIVAIIFGIGTGILLASDREYICGFFSTDEKVVKLAAKVLTIAAVYQIPDCLACVLGGVLRGQGRQYIGGYLNLFSYYVLALPVAFFFGFYLEFELFGLWVGLMVALCFVSSCELYFVINCDWDKIIKDSLDEDLEDMDNLRQILENDGNNSSSRSVFSDDNESISLRPSRSVASLIDHNILSPSINTTLVIPDIPPQLPI